MNNEKLKLHIKNIAWFMMLAIFFLIDRYFKLLAITTSSRPLIANWLNFNFVPNYQISFSLPISGPWLNLFISFIIGGLLFYTIINYKKLKTIEFVSLLGIIIGALSNLIDRFCYGFVIDYLDLKWFTIFNLADVMISIGSLILFFYLIKFSKKSS